MDNYLKSLSVKQYDLFKFSQFLYNRRQVAKATQSEFANYLGWKLANYQRYESGRFKRIPLHVIDTLKEKFGVSEDEFLITSEPYNDNRKLAEWLNKSESKPYILEAYKKYLDDVKAKHIQEVQDSNLRIFQATFGKTDIPDYERTLK